MEIKFFKVATLPGTPAANSIYFLPNGDYAETYVTDSTGVAKMVGNSTMIDERISEALSALNTTQIVADIPARDALAASLTGNAIVYVLNATGDPTVASGAASYLWDDANSTWTKLTEYESLDVVVSWTSISGRPTSTPAQIDSAVTNSHTHANKTLLDGLSDTGGVLYYNGDAVKNWNTANW